MGVTQKGIFVCKIVLLFKLLIHMKHQEGSKRVHFNAYKPPNCTDSICYEWNKQHHPPPLPSSAFYNWSLSAGVGINDVSLISCIACH